MKNILGYKKTNLNSYSNSNIEYDRLGESKLILDNEREFYNNYKVIEDKIYKSLLDGTYDKDKAINGIQRLIYTYIKSGKNKYLPVLTKKEREQVANSMLEDLNDDLSSELPMFAKSLKAKKKLTPQIQRRLEKIVKC